jgi:hypothetical protein
VIEAAGPMPCSAAEPPARPGILRHRPSDARAGGHIVTSLPRGNITLNGALRNRRTNASRGSGRRPIRCATFAICPDVGQQQSDAKTLTTVAV